MVLYSVDNNPSSFIAIIVFFVVITMIVLTSFAQISARIPNCNVYSDFTALFWRVGK